MAEVDPTTSPAKFPAALPIAWLAESPTLPYAKPPVPNNSRFGVASQPARPRIVPYQSVVWLALTIFVKPANPDDAGTKTDVPLAWPLMPEKLKSASTPASHCSLNCQLNPTSEPPTMPA